MASEPEEIAKTLKASRVVRIPIANPHGPLGLEELAQAVAQLQSDNAPLDKKAETSVRVTIGIAIGAMILACQPLLMADEAKTVALHVGNRTSLFLDDRFIAEQSGLKRVFHQGVPTAVIVDRTEPCEAAGKPGAMHMYGSVVHDPQDGSYKMYYQVWSPYLPGAYAVCMAVSKDGKSWTKPRLGQVEIQGNRDNNVLLSPAAHPHVFIDPHEKRPEARYKMLPWCMGAKVDGKKLNSLHLFESADGMRWRYTHPVGVPQPMDDTAKARTVLDAYHIFWDTLGQRYLGTFRAFPSHPGLPGFFRDEKYRMSYGIGGHRRAVAVSSSDKLSGRWPASETVLRADAEDDRRVARMSDDDKKLDWSELYILPACNYGNHYIGWLSLLDWVDESDTKAGSGDLQFAFSHDGRRWHRPPQRQSAIARGEDKTLFGTYAMGNEPLDMGNEMWIYYTEANGAHPIDPLSKFVSRLRAAAWRKDGFASMDCPDSGALTTKPLMFAGKQLRVNCDTREDGSLRVAVLDEDGKPLPGFAAANCKPIAGDDVSALVEWTGTPDLARLQERPVRLRFELTRGRLWSFRFGP